MKKLLLLSCFLTALTLQAQDFWTEYTTAQPIQSTGIRSISIVNQNVTWLNMGCGTTGCATIRRYAKSTNGGSLWTTGAIDLGAESAQLEIANICGVSASVAYLAAFQKSSLVQGGIWKTIDGGTTWTKQNSASFFSPTSFPNLVYFWNANDGIAMGDPVDGYFEIYTTSNAGDTWTRIPSSQALLSIDASEYGDYNNFTVNGNTIWAMTSFGRLLKSVDKGQTWTVSQTPFVNGNGIAGPFQEPYMAFSDQNNGLLQTDDFIIYGTNDGGATWADVPWTGVLRNFNIAAVPGMPDTYISIGEDLESVRGSSFSIDNGLTWFDINNNPDTNYVDGGVIAMLNEDHGFASGFTDSPTAGGIFRWGGGPLLRTAHLSVSAFSGDKSIMLAPNPTSGTLHITGKNINQVAVCDIVGKQIAVSTYSAVDHVNLNLDFLSHGVYLIKVSNDKGISTAKLVKQ